MEKITANADNKADNNLEILEPNMATNSNDQPQPAPGRRAGILTFHWAHNYGAILQTYGLQQALRDYFPEVEVVDYAPAQYRNIYRPFARRQPRALLRDALLLPQFPSRRRREQRFCDFIATRLNLSASRFEQRGELDYDNGGCLFCGSDQIWNPDLTGGFDPVYFAAVRSQQPCRRVAYAASSGRTAFSLAEQDQLGRLLANFDYLSVRERSLQKVIQRQTGLPVHTVLDPTLLLSGEQWRQAAQAPAEAAAATSRPYLLLYSVAGYQLTRQAAQRIADQRGLELVELANDGKSPRRRYPHATVSAAGPGEFLSLFQRAQFVVTDSFHGTAFALVFAHDFYCVPHQTRGSRMIDLLQALGLENCLLRELSGLDPDHHADYAAAQPRLEALRQSSRDFLRAVAEGRELPWPSDPTPALSPLYHSQEYCCGCGLCADLCPQAAIRMEEDAEGFRYPRIDAALCTDCGLCRQSCAFAPAQADAFQQQVYACRLLDEAELAQSSSGGLFTAVSDVILNQGGAVYGAVYDQELRVSHGRATDAAGRNAMRGSKYVQSEISASFGAVLADLRNGRPVLFSGTPCQTAALAARLAAEADGAELRPRLYLVDILCHGVPSPKLFAAYLDYCAQQRGSRIVGYNCRSKAKGWHTATEEAVYADGRTDHSSPLSQSYQRLFYAAAALRPSCYNCHFSSYTRPSDLTIGDYWGIEKAHPEFDDQRGVSLALINTQQGQRLFAAAQPALATLASTAAACRQLNLCSPTPRPGHREQLWRLCAEQGPQAVIDFYHRRSRRSRRLAPLVKLRKRLRK